MQSHDQPEELGRLIATATSRASEALGLLLCDEIRIKGLGVYYLSSPARLLTRLRLPRHLFTVTQTITGDERGKLSLALARESASNLAALLIGRRGMSSRKLGGFEIDALKETANIITGAYLGLLGRSLGLVGVPSVPTVIEGTPEEIALTLLPQSNSLCVEARLLAPAHQIEMLLLMAVGREHVARQPAEA